MNYAIIRKDDKLIAFAETNPQLGGLEWFSKNVLSSSMDHAIKHEGYSVELVEEVNCHDVEAMLSSIADAKGLEFKCTFVPYSQALRTHGKDHYKSLNWKVQLTRNGREVHSFDYSQGVAHCPAYKARIVFEGGKPDKWQKEKAIDHEIENGCEIKPSWGGFLTTKKRIAPPSNGELFSCILRDASCVVDNSFEDFCAELGYDSDSREAESIYNECVAIEKALLNAIGRSELANLIALANFN